MNKIITLISICVLGFLNISVADTIYAEVNADTATIWHKNYHTNCASLFMMEFREVDNHIFVYEIDTGDVAYCLCYFNLNTKIGPLSPGYYTVDVYGKWRDYPNDSALFGSTSFTIEGNMPNVPALIGNHQSDCFQNVGIEELPGAGLSAFTIVSIDPNPVSVNAAIHIIMYNSALIEITAFNSLGQAVVNVYKGWLGKGDHSINWNISNLNPGIYFLAFRAGNGIITKKIIVAR